MLSTLKISNYAIIDKVELKFDNNLNIITGETGAGKSIILGALSLLMGNRADSKVLYNQEKKCIVEAIYINFNQTINEILEKYDLDNGEELIIRREIIPSGKSRAFVNDTPVKLNVLSEMALELIDLNGQFQVTDIHRSDFYLNLIDSLAKHQSDIQKYKRTFKSFKTNKTELAELISLESTQIKEMDFMNFQLKELNEADLSIEEQSQLESESAMLEKAEDVNQLIQESHYLLSDSEENIKDILKGLSFKWENLRGLNPKVDQCLDLFSEIDELIQTAYAELSSLASDSDNDPIRLLEIQDRLSTIYKLQKKHGVNSIKELLDISGQLTQQLSSYTHRTEKIESLKAALKKEEVELNHLAEKISKKRLKVIPKIEEDINSKMTELAMPSAEIKFDCKKSEQFRSDGKDVISILFKANRGGHFQPIRKVASGGESSRLMLSLKSTVANIMEMPTMIFDEIDTGISGDIAGKIGDIIKDLSNKHQIICITHSPQVASRADNHFFVYKEETKNRTVTHVKLLDTQQKVVELAKMLSGDPPSSFAMENAKDLLKSSTDN